MKRRKGEKVMHGITFEFQTKQNSFIFTPCERNLNIINNMYRMYHLRGLQSVHKIKNTIDNGR